jgi:hypothetical protein
MRLLQIAGLLTQNSKSTNEFRKHEIVHMVTDRPQNINNGLTRNAGGASWCELYLAGNHRLHVHFPSRFPFDDFESGEYCAIFRLGLVDRDDMQVNPAHGRKPEPSTGYCDVSKQEQPVLIEIRQLPKPEKWISFRSANSMVRLQSFDVRYMYSRSTRGISLSVPVIPIPVANDRELRVPIGNLIVQQHEIPHQMVKTGSEIIDSIANDSSPKIRNLFDIV